MIVFRKTNLDKIHSSLSVRSGVPSPLFFLSTCVKVCKGGKDALRGDADALNGDGKALKSDEEESKGNEKA